METYETTDLALASLLTMSFPVTELRMDGGRGTFVFSKSEALQATIKAFWDGELNVEPKSYFDAIKALKSRLYNTGNGGMR